MNSPVVNTPGTGYAPMKHSFVLLGAN